MVQEKRYTARAKVVSIFTSKQDLSSKNAHRNNALVEFTDYNGEPAKGSFRICDCPLYTTIRVNSIVEIEYRPSKMLSKYTVFLLNPELYERVPTEEEMAPYKRNKKRVILQSVMAVLASFVALVLYGITRNFLVLAALGVAIFFIMKFGAKQSLADKDKFLTWYQQDEMCQQSPNGK